MPKILSKRRMIKPAPKQVNLNKKMMDLDYEINIDAGQTFPFTILNIFSQTHFNYAVKNIKFKQNLIIK